MKRFYYLILILVGTVFMQSCKDDCTQDAYCQLIGTANSTFGTLDSCEESEKVLICHNSEPLMVCPSAVQFHIDQHGDTVGECGTLSAHGLEFRDGEIVEIPCSYDLPFIHISENGTQWLYSNPSNR